MTALDLQASPFADEFVDVAAVNAHISTCLLDRLTSTRDAANAGKLLPTKAIAVLGPAGAGKTHLFARLRHQAGPHATMLLLRPYFGVSFTPRDVLASVVDQMCRPARSTPLCHLELIVAHWLAEAEAPASFPSVAVQQVRAMDHEARRAHVDRAVGRVLEILPDLAPATRLVRAVLGLGALGEGATWSELAWLSGREPRESTEGDTLSEPDVLHVLRLLAVLAAPVAPIVLVFDQLENLASDGEGRVLGYGNLLAELVDTVPLLTIVQLALTSEWLQFIEPRLSLPQKSRMAAETFVLEIPGREQRELLLRAWHEHLAPKRPSGRPLRYPAPLSKDQLEQLLAAPGMTPRLLLTALSRAATGQSPFATSDTAAPVDRAAHFERLVAEERALVSAELAEKTATEVACDPGLLAEGLASALAYCPKLEIATRTERERVFSTVQGRGQQMQVVWLTSTHHASVAALLARATEMAKSGKVLVVRERRFELSRSWVTVAERRAAFECLPNARWLWLADDDVIQCLTLARLLSRARSKRIRDASDEPLSMDDVRMKLGQLVDPASWNCTCAVARALDDVPKESVPPAPTPAARAPKRTEEPDLRAMVEQWLVMGRHVGRLALDRSLQRLRHLAGRQS